MSEDIIANIRQVGAPRSDIWYIDHTHPDLPKRLRKSLGTKDRAEAQERANARLRAALEAAAAWPRRDVPGTGRKRKRAAFSGFARWWLDNVVALMSEGTCRAYEQSLRLWWVPAFGGRDLRDITNADVQVVIRQMMLTLQPSSVNRHCVALQSMYKAACAAGFADDTPTKGVVKPRVVSKPIDPWTREQASKFLAYVRENDPYWHAPMMIVWSR
jgi:hypothetical protein